MNIAELIIGVAGIVGGVKAVSKGLGDSEDDEHKNKITRIMSSTPYTTHVYEVRTIGQRVARIIDLARKGRDNPHVREFAVKAVSKRCGEKWCIAEKDYVGELDAVYRATRNHVRYVRDTFGKDLFQSPSRTFQFGGGDCFPESTLFLTRDGFVPVEQIEVGDEIHDGQRWVSVLKTWDRGTKRVLRFTLNNGCVLRVSDTHKMLVVPRIPNGDRPGTYESAIETMSSDVRVGDDLLQPRGFEAVGSEELDDDDSFLIGAYLSEGCRSHKKKNGPDNWISIAGIANGKGIRERLIEILKRREIPFTEREREIRFHTRFFERSYDLGRIAIEKQIHTLKLGPRTISKILQAMEMGDGGLSTSGTNMVYSTISPLLALQYRVLKRMMGQSVGWHSLTGEQHGGFGKNTVHRLTVREENERRPWAKVKAIELEDDESPCFDVMTESGRVYLPESDVITRQCDDFSIVIASCMGAIGYPVRLRVIRTKGSADWNHIYNTVGIPPRMPKKWVPVDASVNFGVGWQAPKRMVAEYRDFQVP